MKIISLAITVAALVSFRVAAEAATSPRIRFDKTTHDFGEVKRGEVAKPTFYFTNTGPGTLKVLDVKPGCGCTTAGTWDKEVPAGGTGAIPLQFNSAGFSGNISKAVTVTFEDPEQPVVVLTIQGKVWTPVEVNPTAAVFTFAEDSTNSEVRTIQIVNHEAADLKLEAPQVGPGFNAEIKTIKPGKEFELRISMSSTAPSGNLTAPITVRTSSKEMPVISVYAMAVSRPAVAVSPQTLILPAASQNNVFSPVVTIRSDAGPALALSEASSNVPGVRVEPRELQPGRLFQLSVVFPVDPKLEGVTNPEISVKTSHPRYPVLRIPIIRTHAPAAVSAAPPAPQPPRQATFGPSPTPVRGPGNPVAR